MTDEDYAEWDKWAKYFAKERFAEKPPIWIHKPSTISQKIRDDAYWTLAGNLLKEYFELQLTHVIPDPVYRDVRAWNSFTQWLKPRVEKYKLGDVELAELADEFLQELGKELRK